MSTMTQPRLKARYNNTIKAELAKQLGIENEMQIPKIEKIVINSGVKADAEKTVIQELVKDITMITGQNGVTLRSFVPLDDEWAMLITQRGSLTEKLYDPEHPQPTPLESQVGFVDRTSDPRLQPSALQRG